MKLNKRILALVIALQSIPSLTGCSTRIDVNKLPTTGFSQTKDVRDYYKAQMNYDNVITRTNNVNYTQYEKHSVTDETAQKIKQAQKDIEQLLSQNIYDSSAAGAKYMDESAWAYFKSDLEDKELSNPSVGEVTEADGFYFVDVTYDLKQTDKIGEFTNYTPLVGINGAFIRDSANVDHVEPYYLASICTALNNYYAENNISTRLNYDGTTFQITSDGSEANVIDVPDSYYNDVVNGPDTQETDGQEAGTQETDAQATDTNEISVQEGWDGTITNDSVSALGGRDNPIDITVINNLVGAQLRSRAYLPKIDLVYTVADSNALSGWAIYPQGIHDLSSYGYNRSGVNGTCKVRYVFKQDLNDPTKIDGYNAYIVEETNNYGIENSGNTVFVADYVMTELNKVIERWDRAVVNNDLPGMQSGNLLKDMGMGIDYAYKFSNGNIARRVQTLRKVLGRNTDDNTFLLDVETYTEEGSKSSDLMGQYISEYYVTVKQIGQGFYITDWALQNRKLQMEPDINPDKSTQRRLVALNLSGDVDDATREEIRSFMADYYLACNKLAGNDFEYTNNGTTVTKRGLYSLVEADPTMLDEDSRKDLLETVVNYMQKNNGASNYVGSITEWIGGTETQVEIQTEELWTWNTGTAEYQTVYYLLSHMGDQWVLDQRTVLSSQTVEQTGIESYLNRIQADMPEVKMVSISETSTSAKDSESSTQNSASTQENTSTSTEKSK